MGTGNHQESGGYNDNGHHDSDQQSDNEAGYQQEADDEDGGVEGSDDTIDAGHTGRVAGDDDCELSEDHYSLSSEARELEHKELSKLSEISTDT